MSNDFIHVSRSVNTMVAQLQPKECSFMHSVREECPLMHSVLKDVLPFLVDNWQLTLLAALVGLYVWRTGYRFTWGLYGGYAEGRYAQMLIWPVILLLLGLASASIVIARSVQHAAAKLPPLPDPKQSKAYKLGNWLRRIIP